MRRRLHRVLCWLGLHGGGIESVYGVWPWPAVVHCPHCDRDYIDHGPGSVGY